MDQTLFFKCLQPMDTVAAYVGNLVPDSKTIAHAALGDL
jgi:hypothetical protein